MKSSKSEELHPAIPLSRPLRQRAEERARQNGTLAAPISIEAAREVLEELHVHQIELEMQNEELRRTQHELTKSRARYFSLYDLAPVGYLTLSEKGLIKESNLAVATMLGKSRHELLNQPISKYIFAADQDLYYLQRKKGFSGQEVQIWEIRLIQNDGEPFWVQIQATQADNDDYWLTLTDVTRRRRTEEQLLSALQEIQRSNETLERRVDERTDALGKSEALYRSILTASPDNITITDLHGLISMVSPAALAMFRFQHEEEMIGHKAIEFLIPEDRERATHKMFQENISELDEYQALRPDGSTFAIEANSAFIRSANGKPINIIFILRDITERRLLQETLQGALENERQMLLEQRQFLSVVSHEFRTPLAVIDSAATNLTAVPPTDQDDLDQRAQQIRRATRSLTQLIDNCLTSERIEHGGFKLLRRKTEIFPLLAAATQLVNFSSQHTVQIECDDALATWDLDATLIKIALSNLVDNAIKYSGEGTVTVTVENAGDELRIAVANPGRSISSDEARNLFKKFVRGSVAKHGKNIRGSGLGLFISQSIAQAHGGDVVFRTEQEGVTVFELRIPGS